MENKAEFIAYKKLLIFGAEETGKSSFVSKLETNSFPDEYTSSEKDIFTTRLISKINDKQISVDALEFRTKNQPYEKQDLPLLQACFYECQCALFFIDITSLSSFESIKHLLKAVSQISIPHQISKYLIANKTDLESKREVPSFEIKSYTESDASLKQFDLSLTSGEGFKELQEYIYKSLFENTNKLPVNVITECISHQKNVTSSLITQGALRVVLLGDTSVGKTAFLNRYFKHMFNENFLSTIGIDDETTYIKVKDELYKLTVWDTAGQERFRALPKKYYQNADGILLLFDVTSRESFSNVQNWMKDIKDNTTKPTNDENDSNSISIFLLGNKIDINDENRVVTKEEAEQEAKALGMKYYEVSCKLNLNISEVMAQMIVECYSKTTGDKNVFELTPRKGGKKDEKKGCC